MDFANVLTQIKAGNPDCPYANGYMQELILILRQTANLGMSIKALRSEVRMARRSGRPARDACAALNPRKCV